MFFYGKVITKIFFALFFSFKKLFLKKRRIFDGQWRIYRVKGEILMEFLEDSKFISYLSIFKTILLFLILGLLIKSIYFTQECKCDEQDNLVSYVEEDDKKDDIQEDIVSEDILNEVLVDVKGAVKKPGVYKLPANSIVNDAIQSAGGLKSGASTKYINLSKKVLNEMVITIYTNYEINKMNNVNSNVCTSTDENIKDCEGSSIVVTGDDKKDNTDNKNDSLVKDEKISINTAGKEELMKLEGIGESKALAIIDYRSKNNGFKSLEELMNVSGIGEVAYSKIKDFIKL